MIDTLLSSIAPHLCCSCGKIGAILCDNCKYNISDGGIHDCIICGDKYHVSNMCRDCSEITQRGWCVGQRTDTLRKLINDYKFENMKAAHKILANLLDSCVDHLPESTVVVPIPTVPAHIRQRGYDHTKLIARSFARCRGLQYQPILKRATNTRQRDATRSMRIAQARQAFMVPSALSPNRPYLLLDDIVTTGATLMYGAKALRMAGAEQVWVAAVARQPLD